MAMTLIIEEIVVERKTYEIKVNADELDKALNVARNELINGITKPSEVNVIMSLPFLSAVDYKKLENKIIL